MAAAENNVRAAQVKRATALFRPISIFYPFIFYQAKENGRGGNVDLAEIIVAISRLLFFGGICAEAR